MSRVLSVVVLVLALAGAILWFRTASSTERGSRASETGPPAAENEPSPAALEPPLTAQPDAAALPADEPAARARPSAAPAARREAATSKDAELSRAQWIDGRVLFPAGTPDDEQVFVTVDGWAFDDGSDHRVQVGREGSFHVAFSEKTRTGRITLEARYLYLHEIVRWKSKESSGEIVLEPKLGARIAGRVRVPDRTDASKVGGKVNLTASRRTSNAFEGEQRGEYELSNGLDFAFDALLPGADGDLTYAVSYDGEVFLGRSGKLVPEAGKTLALELKLRPGLVLAGVVRDESGQPVGGVWLNADVDSNSTPWTNASVRDTASAADGSFRLGALAGGEVELRIEHPGYEPLVRELGKLEEGQEVKDLLLVLARGSSIAGTVRWPDGSPAEAYLVLTPLRTGLQWIARNEVNGTSDENGAFSFGGLSQESYRLGARATKIEEILVKSEFTGKERPKKQRTQWTAVIDPVKAGTQDLVLTLSTGLTVVGRVVDDLGAPLEDFVVRADRVESGPNFRERADLSRSFRDTDGSFRMDGFAPGAWKVWGGSKDHAESEQVSVTLPGAETVTLVVPREAVVSGRVLDPGGAPVEGASVQVSLVQRPGYSSQSEEQATKLGFFRIDRLGPGVVTLQASGFGWAPSAPESLELTAGETRSDIALRLRPGATILGELVGADGRPQSGPTVWVSVSGQDFANGVETDADGRFRATGIPPGDVDLSVETLDGIELEQRVRVALGETVHVRLALPGRVVRLHGHVRAGGAPLANASLWASRTDEGDYASASSSSKTGEDGAYELLLPCSGRHWLSIDSRDDQWLSWRVTLDAPEVEAFEFDVTIPVGRISGRVTDTQGQAIAGVLVKSEPERHEGDAHGSARALTDAEGRYELHVPAGEHAVKAGGGRTRWPQDEPQAFAETRVGGLVVDANGHLRGVDLRLDTGGILEGAVRMADGSSARRVWVWAQADFWQENAQSDEAGLFRMRLAAGSYLVSASSGDESACEPVSVEIASGETRRVELELVPARRVLLTILQNGTPVGCELQVLDVRGERQRVQTRENGKAWLGPLIPGKYTVRAQRDGQEIERAFEVIAGQEQLELELVFE